MAVNIAHTMTKPEILAGYLNDSYYGNGAWGIEAAAETYFNTTAAKLTLTQAATLAGIVENPTRVRPAEQPGRRPERRNTVLARIAQTNPSALARRRRHGPRGQEARAAPGPEAERLLRAPRWARTASSATT